jgi:hypothetical protein
MSQSTFNSTKSGRWSFSEPNLSSIPRSEMPETFTCLCGHQKWVVYSPEHIQCDGCDAEYNIVDVADASDFNSRREELTVD